MKALSKQKIDLAETKLLRLSAYLNALIVRSTRLELWLTSHQIDSVDEFSVSLRRNEYPIDELRGFCRNAVEVSSLGYLEEDNSLHVQ